MPKQTIQILMLIAAAGHIAPAADLLTLDQAIDLALEQNRGLQNSILESQKAQDNVEANRTRQFPSFSLTATGAQQLQSFDFTIEKGALGNYAGTGPLPGNDVHLKSPMEPSALLMNKVSQPLSSLIRIRRNLDTLKTGVEIANEQTRADRQKTIRDVKRAYYSLQQLQASLRSVRQTQQLYAELEKLTENYVAGAVVLKGDLLDVQTRVARTEQTAQQILDQMASGKEQLNQLLGREVLIDFEVQPVLETAGDELSLEAARGLALTRRPEVRQAQLRQKQAEQELSAKKAEYIPDVSADVNAITLLNYGRFLPVQSTSVGISVSWEPFDWGRKKHEMAGKQRTVDEARNTQRDAENAVLIDVNDKYRQLRQSRMQLRVARLEQETSIENLRVAKNRYAVEAALLKDVLQNQAGLEQSNSDYQQALVTFWNARAEFERALGEDR
jgi:outer membrane protein TolC